MIFAPFANLSSRGKKIDYISFSGFTNDATTYTGQTNIEIGTYIVAVHWESAASRSLSSVTFNGAATTNIQTDTYSLNPYIGVSLRHITITGSTNDISITFSNNVTRSGIALWKISGINSITPAAINGAIAGSGTSASLGLSTGFVGGDVGVALITLAVQNSNITWSNATKRYDESVEALANFSGADLVAADPNNINVAANFNSSAYVGISAIWN